MYPQDVQAVELLLESEALPSSYGEDANQWFLPAIHELIEKLELHNSETYLLGINGAQGTGKSTLARLIENVVQARGYKVANLSIDDFYSTRKSRSELGDAVHPLFHTRGVPGTHDVELLLSTIEKLGSDSGQIQLPRFDKANDDRVPESEFDLIRAPVNLIILEGWFIGVDAQETAELSAPINKLELEEDKSGDWRLRVNECLQQSYQPVFRLLDSLIMLKAPSFEQVYEWRGLQERKLAMTSPDSSGVMNETQLQRFIQHYERLTRHCLATLPGIADIVFQLDDKHRVVSRSDN